MSQGIYQEFELMTHDPAWAVALDLVQAKDGSCFAEDAFLLIEQSGYAEIRKE